MTDVAASPHPRDVFDLFGADAAEADFQHAVERGRLHHAWLLCGAEGVGKATFAYRASRRLLGARPDPSHGTLGSRPDDPVCRQVSARSHPDLLVLERASEDGKARRIIPVDEARKLPEFFSKAPASSDYRVAIIDAVDDMNANAANALLKTLEEPPARGVLFLVSHAPGGLLPTIRSRCRKLNFSSQSIEFTAKFVEQRATVTHEDAERLARMSHGAPGRALNLAAADALGADAAATRVIEAASQPDSHAALQALAEGFRGGEGAPRFRLLTERLSAQLHERAIARAEHGETAEPALLDAWARLSHIADEVEGLNLDRADAFWSLVETLKETSRR